MSDTKRLISNFLSLSSVQIANYILPLITVPYLVRVLGPEKYGLIAFAQAFITYFALLTDYGFSLSATRTVSINRENKDKISDIFCSVVFIKMVFMLINFLILCVIIFSFIKFRNEWLLYLLTFSMIFGDVLFPVWFFQGLEKMKQIAILNFIAKIVFTVSVFMFIRTQNDYIYLPLINSLGFITAGIISLYIVIIKFEIKIKKPSLYEMKYQLKEGWHVFISKLAISLYTVSNTFILGIFTNDTIVGYYSAGEKIVKAVQGLYSPLSQTIYPHISKLASESKEATLMFVKKIVSLVGGITLTVSIFLFIFAHQISNIILGQQFQESIPVIQILSFLPFIIGLSNIFGIQVMLNFGLKQIFTRILVTASFINIIIAIIFVVPLKHIGISISVLITEIFVTLTMFYVLKKHGFKVLNVKLLQKV